MFTRRLGEQHRQKCTAALFCPDVLELETGEFAIIGKDVTEVARPKLPSGASCGPDERIVVIPRELLIAAKSDIPDRG